MANESAEHRADAGSENEARTITDQTAVQTWLLCRTGPQHFALPLPDVIETMRMLPIQPIAGAPALVRGVCVVRAEPVLVIDTALLFGSDPGVCSRLVTVRTGDRTIALAADAVSAVIAFPAHALTPLPPLLRDDDAVAAVVARDRDLVFLLQAARTVPEDFVIHAGGQRVES